MMMHRLYRSLGIVSATVVLSAGLLTSCDTAVDPISGTDQPFSLFGLLTPQLDTQRVLVFPIEDQLRLLPGEPLNATFRSTNLGTNEQLVWTDSLVPQDLTGFNHLFWAPFTADFGQTYRLEVEDPSGFISEAQVTVPPLSEIELLDPDLLSDVFLQVLVRGDVENLLKIEIRYAFDYRQLTPGEKLDHLVLPIDDRKTRVPEGWLIRINLSRDQRTIREFIRAQRALDIAYGISLQGILLRLIVANEEWSPPGGAFDPEVLVQPGTMSNVENGFGFVGAGYRLSRSWLPADSVRKEAGFR